jgi:hypothetical protein
MGSKSKGLVYLKKGIEEEQEEKEPAIVYSNDARGSTRICSEDERVYSDYIKFKDMTGLIQELGILKYELKFFEREIDSLPRDKSVKARRRKERTFKNICAVEKEIGKRMNER